MYSIAARLGQSSSAISGPIDLPQQSQRLLLSIADFAVASWLQHAQFIRPRIAVVAADLFEAEKILKALIVVALHDQHIAIEGIGAVAKKAGGGLQNLAVGNARTILGGCRIRKTAVGLEGILQAHSSRGHNPASHQLLPDGRRLLSRGPRVLESQAVKEIRPSVGIAQSEASANHEVLGCPHDGGDLAIHSRREENRSVGPGFALLAPDQLLNQKILPTLW